MTKTKKAYTNTLKTFTRNEDKSFAIPLTPDQLILVVINSNAPLSQKLQQVKALARYSERTDTVKHITKGLKAMAKLEKMLDPLAANIGDIIGLAGTTQYYLDLNHAMTTNIYSDDWELDDDEDDIEEDDDFFADYSYTPPIFGGKVIDPFADPMGNNSNIFDDDDDFFSFDDEAEDTFEFDDEEEEEEDIFEFDDEEEEEDPFEFDDEEEEEEFVFDGVAPDEDTDDDELPDEQNPFIIFK